MNLKYRQNLPLSLKIKYTEDRIYQWHEYWGGQVYVSFSGGKDSTVLLDIARKLFPNIEAVFSDTGLEFPEIREFVKTIDNVTWVKPVKNFKQIVEEYGYPIVSKMCARKLRTLKNPTDKNINTRHLYLTGFNSCHEFHANSKLPIKWRYLKEAPFKISEQCCNFLKKEPIKKYEKISCKKPIIGTMAHESQERTRQYNSNGCNAFNLNRPISTPIAFWTDKDIWQYIDENRLSYSKIYDMGYNRTGCMFCLFGHHLENIGVDDRLTTLAKTHPKQHKYIMDKLNFKEVLEWYPKKKDRDDVRD